jgi:PAS domain S-box-containing protein
MVDCLRSANQTGLQQSLPQLEADHAPGRHFLLKSAGLMAIGILILLSSAVCIYIESLHSDRLARLHSLKGQLTSVQTVVADCTIAKLSPAGAGGHDPAFVEGCRTGLERPLVASHELAEALNIDLGTMEATSRAFLKSMDRAANSSTDKPNSSRVEDLLAMRTLAQDVINTTTNVLASIESQQIRSEKYSTYFHSLQLLALFAALALVTLLYVRTLKSHAGLQELAQFERAMWSNSGDALYVIDVESGLIIDANSRAADLTGLKREQMIGEKWSYFALDQIAVPTPDSSDPDATRRLVKFSIYGTAGRKETVEASISKEIFLGGRRIAVYACRPRTSYDPQLTEGAFRKIIETSVPIGMAAITDDGEQIFVNANLCEMLGWQREELVAKRPPFEYWPPEHQDQLRAIFEQVIAGLIGPSGAEVTLMRRSGERFPARLLVCRSDHEGQPGWMTFIVDLTETKRFDSALEESRRLEGIGRLAGQVAHDFNNILAIIELNVSLAKRSPDTTDLSQQLDTIRAATLRGARVTQALLSIARRQTLTMEPVEIGRQIVQLQPLFEAACGPDFDFTIESSEPIWAKIDVSGFSSALLNLVINARDAMPDGGPIVISTAAVAITERDRWERPILEAGRYCAIEVRDAGHGMPPEVRNRAFEPFFSTKGEVGTGLGLPSVYGFSRQSGGSAEIESEPDRGTTVRLLIPTCPALATDSIGTSVQPVENNCPYNILIVDDEPELLTALGAALSAMGHGVTLAHDSATALAHIERRDFDILLTDVVMPGTSGLELAAAAAREQPDLPIVLMTGYGMWSDDEAPPWPTVLKPINLSLLQKIMKYASEREHQPLSP